jgi:hypothetical protein
MVEVDEARGQREAAQVHAPGGRGPGRSGFEPGRDAPVLDEQPGAGRSDPLRVEEPGILQQEEAHDGRAV